jgi:hypothetical protein
MNFIILFRPVGKRELELIEESDYKKFPPRLPDQEFFYPVLNEEYAIEIAKNWNTKDINSDYFGCVTKFKVKKKYIEQFEIHNVGGKNYLEYWIPANKINEFNKNIIDDIEIIHEFKG